MKEICFIGVDAGGTKTLVQAFKLNGEVIASTKLGTGSVANSLTNALSNIENGIRFVYNEVRNDYEVAYIVVGVSGLGSYPKVEELKEYYEKEFGCPVDLVSDASIALSSITTDSGKNGILVLAGTGVVIYGTKGEKRQMIGGWGFHLYEKGSAYSVVHKCVLSSIFHYEKGMELTKLEQGLLDEMGLPNVNAFRVFFYQDNPKQHVAKYAKYIKDMARLGDEQAIAILVEAGVELANQVIDLVNLLKLDSNTLLGLRGGFFTEADIVIEAFNNYLEKQGFKFEMVEYHEPIIGAYYQALEAYKRGISK